MQVKETRLLTVDERSFRNPKLREAVLISYKTVADLVGKGALFAITIFAARRLAPEAFGVFSLGTTLGWIVAVASDFGIQLHLAREVARNPQAASQLLATWLRVRLWLAIAAMLAVSIVLAAFGWPASFVVPVAVLALVYTVSGLIELLHYFYRGLSRSDVESTLTLWQRASTLACGLIALALWPSVTALAFAMLVPAAFTLAASARIARRLSLAGDAGLRDTTISADASAGDTDSRRPADLAAWPIFARSKWRRMRAWVARRRLCSCTACKASPGAISVRLRRATRSNRSGIYMRKSFVFSTAKARRSCGMIMATRKCSNGTNGACLRRR